MAKKASRRTKRTNNPVDTFKANGAFLESREVAPRPRGRPRQQDLPGTEDRILRPLDDIAAAYADVRDRRIELNKEEAQLKASALKLMHKFEKTIYRHDGIEIFLIAGEEDVKVKVRKATDDEDDKTSDQVELTRSQE
jgi:hypothetical protein